MLIDSPYVTSSLSVTGSSSISGSLVVTGSLTVVTGSSVEFQVLGTGVKIGDVVTDIHQVTGSLNVSGSITGSLFGTASYATTAGNSVSITNNSDNYVVTATGTGLNGESNFRFDGTTLAVTGSTILSGSSFPLQVNGFYIGKGGDASTPANNFIAAGNKLPLLTGEYNIVIGHPGANLITSGEKNIFLGFNAGVATTVGSNNVFIGASTGISNRSGTKNTLLGDSALGNLNSLLATTANNVAVGASAGLNINSDPFGLLTGSNNCVYVGADTTGFFPEPQNEIVIGYGAAGQSSNSVVLGNNSITKTFLKGKVAVGYTTSTTALTPNATLDVSGSAVISGSFTVVTGSGVEFQVLDSGVKIGNNLTDIHQVTGSLQVNGSITGSLFGTASYVTGSIFIGTNLATSASFATTASYALKPSISYQVFDTAASTNITAGGTITLGSMTYTAGTSTTVYAVVSGIISSPTLTVNLTLSATGMTSHTISMNIGTGGRFIPFTLLIQGPLTATTNLLLGASVAATVQNIRAVVQKYVI